MKKSTKKRLRKMEETVDVLADLVRDLHRIINDHHTTVVVVTDSNVTKGDQVDRVISGFESEEQAKEWTAQQKLDGSDLVYHVMVLEAISAKELGKLAAVPYCV